MAYKQVLIYVGVKNSTSSFTAGLWNNSRSAPAWMNGAHPAGVSLWNSSGRLLVEGHDYDFNGSGAAYSGDFTDKASALRQTATADYHFILSPNLASVYTSGLSKCTLALAAYIYVNKWWDVAATNAVFSPADGTLGSNSKVVETNVILNSTEQDGSRLYYVYMRATGVTVPFYAPGDYYEGEFGLNIVPKSYTVSFDANGSAAYPATVSPSSATVTESSRVVNLPTPVRPGYTFQGWYTAAQGGTQVSSPYTADAADVTLYAHWTPNELVCVFDPNGGLISGNFFVLVNSAGTFPALPTPSYSGNTFQGWYTALTGGTLVQQGDAVTQSADFTLYAHWQGPTVSHEVRFNALGGTVSPASMTVQEGTALGTLPTPTRTGYGFAGWYDPAGNAITAATVMGTDDIYAIAKWSATSVTVTFDANGGTVAESSRAVPYGHQIGTLPAATKSGSKFAGWFTATQGGTQVFSTTTVTSSRTVYARWQAPDEVDWWTVIFS